MKPNESFVNQPIRSLQTMLRVIAEHDHELLSVVPDGFFTVDTSRAVSAFQRRYGLPVTGVADNRTWDTVVELYELALIQQDEAHPIHIVLNPGQVIRQGERHPHLYLVQAMLTVLAEVYESIGNLEVTGMLDAATADALASFQSLSGLPMSGHLDKHTWKQLALQYALAANLQSR